MAKLLLLFATPLGFVCLSTLICFLCPLGCTFVVWSKFYIPSIISTDYILWQLQSNFYWGTWNLQKRLLLFCTCKHEKTPQGCFCKIAHILSAALKVKQKRNNFFNPMFPPKNEQANSTLLLWNLRLTRLLSFFGGNWQYILQLTDL